MELDDVVLESRRDFEVGFPVSDEVKNEVVF